MTPTDPDLEAIAEELRNNATQFALAEDAERQGDTPKEEEEPVFAGPYDAEAAMQVLLDNYQEVAAAKAMWKASAAETKDRKDDYEALVDRQNALLKRFDELKRAQQSGQLTLKSVAQ